MLSLLLSGSPQIHCTSPSITLSLLLLSLSCARMRSLFSFHVSHSFPLCVSLAVSRCSAQSMEDVTCDFVTPQSGGTDKASLCYTNPGQLFCRENPTSLDCKNVANWQPVADIPFRYINEMRSNEYQQSKSKFGVLAAKNNTEQCHRSLFLLFSHVFLQHAATHCSTLQHTAAHYNTSLVIPLYIFCSHMSICSALYRTAAHYNTAQHPSTHCIALQRTAMHCNTPDIAHHLLPIPRIFRFPQDLFLDVGLSLCVSLSLSFSLSLSLSAFSTRLFACRSRVVLVCVRERETERERERRRERERACV